MNYSIVIPTFNNATQLEALVLSLEDSMNGFSFELIIVDDGCSDSTWEVLMELKKRFNFLKIIIPYFKYTIIYFRTNRNSIYLIFIKMNILK
jgi:glycosyltransferase involved in cell wall biosynthesis